MRRAAFPLMSPKLYPVSRSAVMFRSELIHRKVRLALCLLYAFRDTSILRDEAGCIPSDESQIVPRVQKCLNVRERFLCGPIGKFTISDFSHEAANHVFIVHLGNCVVAEKRQNERIPVILPVESGVLFPTGTPSSLELRRDEVLHAGGCAGRVT